MLSRWVTAESDAPIDEADGDVSLETAEVLGRVDEPSPLVLTCEHATHEVPEHIETTPSDRKWLKTHWGWDIGIFDVTRALARMEQAPVVASRYSRLLCDVNRHPQQRGLVRTHIQTEPLSFNQAVDEEEVYRRLATYHAPYHRLVDECVRRQVALNRKVKLISMHSFTPELDGEVRDMEIGVLFHGRQESYADQMAEAFRSEGFETALNEPYSGKNNMIYSVRRHGVAHGIRHLELEIRNDLIDTEQKAEEVASRVGSALHRLPWYGG
jgi:predicted N-formylglutamate amidohydrolase